MRGSNEGKDIDITKFRQTSAILDDVKINLLQHKKSMKKYQFAAKLFYLSVVARKTVQLEILLSDLNNKV